MQHNVPNLEYVHIVLVILDMSLDTVADVQRETNEDVHVIVTSNLAKQEIEIKTMRRKLKQLEKECAELKTHIPMYSEPFMNIWSRKASKKGKKMEKYLLEYFRPMFPYIELTGETHCCDLMDRSAGLCIEVKTHLENYDKHQIIEKFNDDAVNPKNSWVRVWAYIDICPGSTLISRPAPGPFRIFINGKYLCESKVTEIKAACDDAIIIEEPSTKLQ
jgi:hypothetical protein